MEFTDYIEIKNRMTEKCAIECCECPFGHEHNGTLLNCVSFEAIHPETAEVLVKKWGDEHPVKTRQSEFLKMFPRASIHEDGIIAICPKVVDTTFRCSCESTQCGDCRKEYWLEEIEEGER